MLCFRNTNFHRASTFLQRQIKFHNSQIFSAKYCCSPLTHFSVTTVYIYRLWFQNVDQTNSNIPLLLPSPCLYIFWYYWSRDTVQVPDRGHHCNNHDVRQPGCLDPLSTVKYMSLYITCSYII